MKEVNAQLASQRKKLVEEFQSSFNDFMRSSQEQIDKFKETEEKLQVCLCLTLYL